MAAKAKPTDDEIRRRWSRMIRYAYSAPFSSADAASNKFRLRMAALMADMMEAEGVTEADLVRLGL